MRPVLEKHGSGTDFYSPNAKKHKKMKAQPFRVCMEGPSLAKLLGPLTYENAIDLGCGEGFSTRIIKSKTKGVVYGVDISEGNINLAKKEAIWDGEDITYLVQDCSAPIKGLPLRFDVVVMSYLLNYAINEEMIEAFFQTAYDLLKDRGHLVGIIDNVHLHPRDYHHMEKYGIFFRTANPDNIQEGDIVNETLVIDENLKMDFHLNYFKPTTYERIAKKVGFEEFKWVKCTIGD